jgi:hypothetical protein
VTFACEDILMPQTTCAEIQKNSIVVEFDDKSVDFSYNKPVSIADKLLVELLITPCNMQLSFTICVSLPPILSDSQAKTLDFVISMLLLLQVYHMCWLFLLCHQILH